MTDSDFIKVKGGFPKKTLDIIAVGTGKGRSMLPSLYDPQNSVKCWCQTCCKNETGEYHLFRFVVCPECGNKRCPRATNHELECTGSNEPNQEGSIY
jgi:Zn finger protein HypA/HybF involved in hydrogenase expression